MEGAPSSPNPGDVSQEPKPEDSTIITAVPTSEQIAAERGHEPVAPNTGPKFEDPVQSTESQASTESEVNGHQQRIQVVKGAQGPLPSPTMPVTPKGVNFFSKFKNRFRH